MTRFRPVPLTWHYCHTLEGETHLVPLLNPKATNLSPQMLGESDQPQQDEDPGLSWLGGSRQDRRRRRSAATAQLTEMMLTSGQQWHVPFGMVDVLHPERADENLTWIEVGWALHNNQQGVNTRQHS